MWNETQALAIENISKNMKSKIYIENLRYRNFNQITWKI
jgi:hypothetical protein